jgi:hypothetical protein
MNLLQLQTLTLSWLDDPNAGYFTLPQVTVWLNNAQREAQKQLLQAGQNWYTVKVQATTTQNVDSYVLPPEFMRLNKFEIVTSGTGVQEVRQTLSPVTLVQIDQVSQTTGLPACYTIKKNCLVMRPIPDNAYVMYMHYSPRVGDMTNPTDIPDVPIQFQEYLAVLAALDGFLKDQRDPSPFLEKKRYYLELMKEDATNRNVDAPRSVVSSGEYDYGYLF